ncbi:MAG: transcriptional regulator [Chitinophagales bacterium]
MESLKYKVIKTESQYDRYCRMLEELLDVTHSQSKGRNSKSKAANDEIELLTLLIEKWDEEHNTFEDSDPIELLHSFMEEHKLKAKDLAEILKVSKSLVSEILNYKKGLSKGIIRTLSAHFKVSQEAFNRPYKLISPVNSHLRNANGMNTQKNLVVAH